MWQLGSLNKFLQIGLYVFIFGDSFNFWYYDHVEIRKGVMMCLSCARASWCASPSRSVISLSLALSRSLALALSLSLFPAILRYFPKSVALPHAHHRNPAEENDRVWYRTFRIYATISAKWRSSHLLLCAHAENQTFVAAERRDAGGKQTERTVNKKKTPETPRTSEAICNEPTVSADPWLK